MKILKNTFNIFLALVFITCGMVEVFASELPRTGLDSNGNVVIVWQTYTFSGTVVQANTYDASSTAWGTPVTISATESANDPRVAVTANGTDVAAVAIWIEINGSINSLFAAMMPTIGGGWTTAAQISTNGEDVVSQYALNMNANGKITATWSSVDAMNNQYIRNSNAQMSSTNTWDAPSTVSGP